MGQLSSSQIARIGILPGEDTTEAQPITVDPYAETSWIRRILDGEAFGAARTIGQLSSSQIARIGISHGEDTRCN